MAYRLRELAKFQTDDDALNRVQDQLREVLNPFLRTLSTPPTVTGSKGGNAALASLITALATIGLIKDATT